LKTIWQSLTGAQPIIKNRDGVETVPIYILITIVASHFTDTCYNRPGLIVFFAKGFKNAYHSDSILRRSGHNRGVADKSEVDAPGFLCCHQIGLVGSAA
jgi:hypothetical protein